MSYIFSTAALFISDCWLLQGHGATELTLEGVAGVGSEMERIHIAEKNKAMAEKLKVPHIHTCMYLCVYT